jgi:hypothetical protein
VSGLARPPLWPSLVAKALVTALSAVLACVPSASKTRGPWILPGSNAAIEEEIPRVSLCTEGDSVAHVIWVEAEARSTGIGLHRVWYQVWRRSEKGWSKPVLMVTQQGYWPRHVKIAVERSEVHALIGEKLRHFVATGDGQEWRELPSLVAESQLLRAFDVIPKSGGLVVAYLAREHMSDRSFRSGVWATRVCGEVVPTPALIATGPSDSDIAPCASLVGRGDSLNLFYGIYEPTSAGPPTKLFHTRTTDGGESWSTPDEVTRYAQGGALRGYVQTFEGVEVQHKLLLFYNSWELRAIEQKPDGTWSTPVTVGKSRVRTEGAVAAEKSGRGRLIWVDERHRRKDWYRFDYPYWANNDLFSMPLSGFTELALGRSQSKAGRLTEGLSYTAAVSCASWGDSVIVVWSGRTKVGRSLTSYGEPPVLFWAVLTNE